MKSELSGIIVSDFKINKSLVFIDTSIYNKQLPITEAKLSLFLPYALKPITVSYIPKNNTILTTIDLGNTTNAEDIPCGLYKITQSICPNDKLTNEIWYVHVGQIKRNIAELYCENKIEKAKEFLDKITLLEYLAHCQTAIAEKKINAILETLDCAPKEKCFTHNISQIIHIKDKCEKPKEKKTCQKEEKKCGCKQSCDCSLKITNLTIR